MEFINQWLGLIISSATLVMLVIAVYKFSADPDAKADKLLAINAAACQEKHKRLDEILSEIKDRFVNIDTILTLIKENDIKHIENEVRKISQEQTKILTILEYKKTELKG